MKIARYYILLISFLCSMVSLGQKASEKGVQLRAKLSIIAIGPIPPRRFAMPGGGGENSGSTLLPPNPGEVPPRRLFYHNGKKSDKKTASNYINISFNSYSRFVEVSPSRAILLARKNTNNVSEQNSYIHIDPLEPGSMSLVLLRPKGKGDTRWVSKPAIHKVNLLDGSLKGKKLAILNLSDKPVEAVFHKDKKMISSGELVAYGSIEGLELYRIAAAYGNDSKIIYNTAIRLNKDDRLLFYVFYDADPKTNDGRSVGLIRTSVELGGVRQGEVMDK